MKNLLFIVFTFLFLASCSKAPGVDSNSGEAISNDLQRVIEDQQVDAVVVCCVDCECNFSYDTNGSYSFEGSSFINVNSISYNLTNLHSYDVQTIEESDSSSATKVFLVLFFPE